MTDTIQEDVEMDMATGDGRVVSYYCSLVNSQNQLDDLIVPFYYEAAYPCHEKKDSDNMPVRDYVADSLLVRAKREFLDDASFCTNPQRDPWFGRVSSLPEDEFMDESNMACSELQTNEYNDQMQTLLDMGADPMQEEQECCVVVHGQMTFTKLASLENEDVMKTWVAAQLNDITLAPPYRTAYIGSIMEAPPAEDNLDPAINNNDETTQEGDGNGNGNEGGGMTTPSAGGNDLDDLPDFLKGEPTSSSARGGAGVEEDPKFTYVGVLIVIGIVFAVVAVLYLVVRRRRYFFKGLDAQAAVMDSPDGKDDEQAAVVVVKEGTMSVEEDYMDVGDGARGGLGPVTIVPTHTSSSSGGNGPVDSGFAEMLAGDDFSASQQDVENAFPVNVMTSSDCDRTQTMKIQSLAVKPFHTNEEDDDYFMDSASSPVAGGANQHLFHNALDHHNEKGGGGATQTTGSTSSGTYQFDLADANRSAIIGAYMGGGTGAAVAAACNGPPITMTVVPPYPMEETSESDIDSWAQTEGTVGSLEEASRCGAGFEETGEI